MTVMDINTAFEAGQFLNRNLFSASQENEPVFIVQELEMFHDRA